MHPITDSPSDRADDGMTTLDAAISAPAPAPATTDFPMASVAAPAVEAPTADLAEGFDPERLLLGEHGGVVMIVGLLLLALVLLTVAFGALPR